MVPMDERDGRKKTPGPAVSGVLVPLLFMLLVAFLYAMMKGTLPRLIQGTEPTPGETLVSGPGKQPETKQGKQTQDSSAIDVRVCGLHLGPSLYAPDPHLHYSLSDGMEIWLQFVTTSGSLSDMKTDLESITVVDDGGETLFPVNTGAAFPFGPRFMDKRLSGDHRSCIVRLVGVKSPASGRRTLTIRGTMPFRGSGRQGRSAERRLPVDGFFPPEPTRDGLSPAQRGIEDTPERVEFDLPFEVTMGIGLGTPGSMLETNPPRWETSSPSAPAEIRSLIGGVDICRPASATGLVWEQGYFDVRERTGFGLQFFLAEGCFLGFDAKASTIAVLDDRGTDLYPGASPQEGGASPWDLSCGETSVDGRGFQVKVRIPHAPAPEALSLTASGTVTLRIGRDMRWYAVRDLRLDQTYWLEPTVEGYDLVGRPKQRLPAEFAPEPDVRFHAFATDVPDLSLPATVQPGKVREGKSHRLDLCWNPASGSISAPRAFDGDFRELQTTWIGASYGNHRGLSFSIVSPTPVVTLVFSVPSRMTVEKVPFTVTSGLGLATLDTSPLR